MAPTGGTVMEAVGLLFAAVFLLAARRRSRRAAWLGLAGVGLLGLWLMVEACTGVGSRGALAAIGVGDPRTAWAVATWVESAQVAAGYGLLVWAVLADRPPADDE